MTILSSACMSPASSKSLCVCLCTEKKPACPNDDKQDLCVTKCEFVFVFVDRVPASLSGMTGSEFGRITFVFETICSADCELYFMMVCASLCSFPAEGGN